MNPGFSPTDEQYEALARFKTGRSMKINAFAGTGKTSTLTLLAHSRTSSGVYLAFNRSIANEAKGKFPKNVDCRTTHSIAWRTVQPAYRFSSGKMQAKLFANQLADVLALKDHTFGSTFALTSTQRAHLIIRTVIRFCQSDREKIELDHVPAYGRLLGLPQSIINEIKDNTLSFSRNVWRQMIDPRSQMPLGHDGYLKLWALGHPKFSADFILLDEAQDTNPAVLGVLKEQQTQIVYVGDRHQQIYEWRGAINAMQKIVVPEEAYLTQSFRFGKAIADVASKIIATLGEKRLLRGNPGVQSQIGFYGGKTTILARTNATVLREVLGTLSRNERPHVLGGVEELKRLVRDVFELKEGKPGVSPEFFGFTSWQQVVAFAGSEEGEDIRTFVQLVEQNGERKLWAALCGAHDDETTADCIISTAHKAKGREWDNVSISEDFGGTRLSNKGGSPEEEIRLFYVAITRAKRNLNVDQSMLQVFMGTRDRPRTQSADAADTPDVRVWQRHPAAARNGGTGEAKRAQGDLVEVVRPSAQSQHPGAAPERSARHVEPTDVTASSWRTAPSATLGGSPTKQKNRPNVQEKSMWSRIANLFR
jgi:hypothetical protein